MSKQVDTFQEKFKGKIENMGKDGVIGLVKTTQNTSPIATKPMVQITNQQPQPNGPFSGWANAYNNAKKGTKKENIVSSGAMIANQQHSISNHQYSPKLQSINQHQLYANNNIPNYPMMQQQQQPNYFPIGPMQYQQPYAPYNYSPYPPLINYPPSHQIGYLPSYIPPIHQQYPQHQQLMASNKPININITNTVQQPINSSNITDENKVENIFQNDYKPYTLDEYKELNRVAVVMGNLGPNIGTKDWEEKKKKMKRLTDYANKLNKEQKGISRIKTETPSDEKARIRQNKIESSHRFKSFEYSKLVRPKGATSDQFYYNDIGNVKTKNEKSDQILKELNNNNDKNNFDSINAQFGQRDNDMLSEQHPQAQSIPIDSKEVDGQLNYLLKQRENYANKINEIKNSLL